MVRLWGSYVAGSKFAQPEYHSKEGVQGSELGDALCFRLRLRLRSRSKRDSADRPGTSGIGIAVEIEARTTKHRPRMDPIGPPTGESRGSLVAGRPGLHRRCRPPTYRTHAYAARHVCTRELATDQRFVAGRGLFERYVRRMLST